MQFSTKHNATHLEFGRLNNVEDDPNFRYEAVSKPIVMASAAGWYVGQVCRDIETGDLLPWSRNSDYMSEEEAIKYYEYDFNGECYELIQNNHRRIS
jgi:hypothetical protein|tara:strand:+ start:1432 stop:1722 length:291 start_codon:yes stop_codon:yes gene_type:complete